MGRDAIIARMKITSLRRREFLGFVGAAIAHSALPPRLFAVDAAEFDDNLLVFNADIHAGISKKCAHARDKYTEAEAEILKNGRGQAPRNARFTGLSAIPAPRSASGSAFARALKS